MPFVDISNSDYEQRRHASELAAWVNAKFRDLEAGAHFEEQYFERRGENVKRLIEEAVPLSRLGLALWIPGSEPYLTLYPADQNHDGLLEIEGFVNRSFKVEVTTIENDDSTLRRQALSRQGTISLLGPIRRQDGGIVSDPEMVDVLEQTDTIVELAIARMRRKVESRTYDENTAILVYLTEFWPLPTHGRFNLLMRTQEYLDTQPHETSTVYYCFWPDHTIEAVLAHRPRPEARGAA